MRSRPLDPAVEARVEAPKPQRLVGYWRGKWGPVWFRVTMSDGEIHFWDSMTHDVDVHANGAYVRYKETGIVTNIYAHGTWTRMDLTVQVDDEWFEEVDAAKLETVEP